MFKFHKTLSLQDDVVPLFPPDQQAYYTKTQQQTTPNAFKDRRRSVSVNPLNLSSSNAADTRTPERVTSPSESEAVALETRSFSVGSGGDSVPGNGSLMNIVGRQADGSILIARDIFNNDGKRCTVIGSYNTGSKDYADLLLINEPKVIVAASVSHDKNLLAYTTISRIRFDQFGFLPDTSEDNSTSANAEFIYEAWLAEINPQGHIFCLTNLTSRNFVRMFFLDSDVYKSCQLIAIVDKEKALLYKIDLQKRTSVNGMKLRSQPHLQTVIARNFLWFEWDPVLHVLYILQKDEGVKDPNEALFRYFHFNSTQQDHYMSENSIKLSKLTPRDLSKAIFRNPRNPCLWMNGFASPSVYMHVVRIKSKIICLCHQEYIEGSNGELPILRITIYNITLEHRIVIDIRFPHLSADFLSRVHVFFGTYTDLLMVYVPGVYLQFVDCSSLHEASESIISEDPNFATSLPNQLETSHAILCPFEKTHRKHRKGSQSKNGPSFLDCLNGVVYDCNMSDDFLLQSFLTGPSHMHHQLLHLIIVHLRRTDLGEQIIRRLCAEKPQHVTSTLIKEYLLGSTFHRLIRSHNSDRGFYRSLPCTTIEALCTHHKTRTPIEKHKLFSVSYEPMTRERNLEHMSTSLAYTLENVKKKTTLPDKIYSRFSAPPPASPKKVDAATSSVSASQLRSRLINRETPQKEEDDIIQPQSMQQILQEFYGEYLRGDKSVDQSRLLSMADACLHVQKEQVKTFFGLTGARSIGEPQIDYSLEKKLDILEILENLKAALEELCYLCPDFLNDTLCMLAFDCFPKWTFLEYIRSGTIKLNDSLLIKIFNHPKFNSFEDTLKFKFQLLSLVEIEQALPIYRQVKDMDGLRIVLEYILTIMPESKLSEKDLYDEIADSLDDDDEAGESIRILGPGVPLDDPDHEGLELRIIPENLRPLIAFHRWIQASLQPRSRETDYPHTPMTIAGMRLFSGSLAQRDFDSIVRVSKELARTNAIEFLRTAALEYPFESDVVDLPTEY